MTVQATAFIARNVVALTEAPIGDLHIISHWTSAPIQSDADVATACLSHA